MSLREQLKTDPQSEKEGVIISFGHANGDTRFRIARASGSNGKYAEMLSKEMSALRRRVGRRAVKNSEETEIVRRVYAHTIIINCEVNVGDEENEQWARGINPYDLGEDKPEVVSRDILKPFTPENLIKLFEFIPDVFFTIYTDAQNAEIFKEALREEDSKNS